MAPEDLVFVIGSKLMWLVLQTLRVILILLQNLKAEMDYFETFLMPVLLTVYTPLHSGMTPPFCPPG